MQTLADPFRFVAKEWTSHMSREHCVHGHLLVRDVTALALSEVIRFNAVSYNVCYLLLGTTQHPTLPCSCRKNNFHMAAFPSSA